MIMNKKILLGGVLLCAALTSCNEDFKDWASPMSSSETAATDNVSISFSAGKDANLVMNNITNDTVALVHITTTGTDAAFAAVTTLNFMGVPVDMLTFISDGNGGADVYVSARVLDSIAEVTYLDRSATPHYAQVDVEGQVLTEAGEAVYGSGTFEASVTPVSNLETIDPNGYFLLGDWNSWTVSNATWMTEVEPGIYQATVTTTGSGDNWFKFYKGSGYDPDNFTWDDVAMGCAVNGDGTTPNLLVVKDDPIYGGFQTPVINGAATWLITLDMNKFIYKYEMTNMSFYAVGGINGWSTDNAPKCMLIPESSSIMSYTTSYSGAWDLKLWKKDDIGNWDVAYGCVNDGDNASSGDLVNSSAGAISAPEAGYYTFSINLSTMTYSWTKLDNQSPTEYTLIGLIGGFNSWGEDLEMTQVASHNWYAELTLSEDTELKFRANGGWDINWGCDLTITEAGFFGTGEQNGANIKVPAGTYDVYFCDINGNFAFAAK